MTVASLVQEDMIYRVRMYLAVVLAAILGGASHRLIITYRNNDKLLPKHDSMLTKELILTHLIVRRLKIHIYGRYSIENCQDNYHAINHNDPYVDLLPLHLL